MHYVISKRAGWLLWMSGQACKEIVSCQAVAGKDVEAAGSREQAETSDIELAALLLDWLFLSNWSMLY